MRHTSSLLLILVVALAGAALGACGNTPTIQVDDLSTAPVTDSDKLTVVDAMGRTVEFAHPPQRIVVAGKSSLTIADTIFLFPEARDRVAGLVVGNQKPGDFLSFVDASFEQKAVLEVEAGPEQIAPLKPDVVLLRSFMADSLGKPLEQVDIPVVYLDLETPDQYFRDLTTLGQLLDNKSRAGEIQEYYRSELDYVDNKLGELVDGSKPRVLILQYSDKGGGVALTVPSASWIQTTEVDLSGGRPVWKEAAQSGGWTIVGFEQIAAWDPDKVFVIHYQSDSAETVAALRADPQWQALRAAEAEEIYGFASDIFSWDQPDPRWILGVTWLAAKIHPDRFSDLDMKQRVIQFFEQMYGMDKAAIEEHILPTLKGHVE